MKSNAFAFGSMATLLGLVPEASGHLRGVTEKEIQTDTIATTLSTDGGTKASRQLSSCELTPFVPDPNKYYTVGGWALQRWKGFYESEARPTSYDDNMIMYLAAGGRFDSHLETGSIYPYAQPMEQFPIQWVLQESSPNHIYGPNDTGSHWRFIPIEGNGNWYYLKNRFTGLTYAISEYTYSEYNELVGVDRNYGLDKIRPYNDDNNKLNSTAMDDDPRRVQFQLYGCSIDSGISMNMVNHHLSYSAGPVSIDIKEVEEDFAKFDDAEPRPYAFDRPEKMLNQMNNELNLGLSIGMVAVDALAAKFMASHSIGMGIGGGLASAGLSFALNEFLGGDTTHTAINDAINQFATEYTKVVDKMVTAGVTKQLESTTEKTFDGIRQSIYAEGNLGQRLEAFLDPSESKSYLEEFEGLIEQWHRNMVPFVPDPSKSEDVPLAKLGFDLLQEAMLEGLAYYREHILLQSYFYANFDCEKALFQDEHTGNQPKSPQKYMSQLEAARDMAFDDWLDNAISLTSNQFKRNGAYMAFGYQARDVYNQYVQEITHDKEALSYKIHHASFDTWKEKTLEQCNAVRNDKLTRVGFSTGLYTLNFVGVNGEAKLATYVDEETYPLLQSPDMSLVEQQHWAFLPVVDGHQETGFFLIQNVYSGTCLGHAGGSGRYASVGYAVCDKFDTKQQWSGDLSSTSGRSRIANNYGSWYLGASGGCTPTKFDTNQQWSGNLPSTSGSWQLGTSGGCTPSASGGCTPTSGIRLELQPWLSCGADGPQQSIPILQEQPYRVINLNFIGINGDNKYATYDENHSYPLIQSLPLDGIVTEKQSWRVLPADDGSFLLQNVYSGTCIGHASGSGRYVSAGYFACDKSDTRQQWTGDLFSTSGRSRIANRNGDWYLGASGGCDPKSGVRLELQAWLGCGANGPQQDISAV